MSGHSKWANIKHKKAKADAARGANFAKFSREIIIAAKIGGADLNGNFRLRTAVEKAKAGGLPNDTIKRAIDKGAGNLAGDNFEEITYEGYGAGGVAIFIEAATDNRNRTAGDIRSYFTKFAGNLGESGCVGWIFEPCGIISIDKPKEAGKREKIEVKMFDLDKLLEDAMEFNPMDVWEDEDEDDYRIKTKPEDLENVARGLENLGYTIKSADLTRIPSNSCEVTDPNIAKKVVLLLEKLDEHDDVQNVYSNFEASDEIMNSLDI
ncbi:YebC/PmpR family DNA-binding transcriptional regulator [bacterium]|nr:YebC/PmpR family DNA-binding transcriptional regulator [bacterium]